jgi:hypothetical protein
MNLTKVCHSFFPKKKDSRLVKIVALVDHGRGCYKPIFSIHHQSLFMIMELKIFLSAANRMRRFFKKKNFL